MSRIKHPELAEIKKLASIARNLDSPDMQIMYSAGGSLVEQGIARSLLPKAMSLLTAEDPFIRKLVFRLAGQNAFGTYIDALFDELKEINPAEREQVLHAIEERFSIYGAPYSKEEQALWISVLDKLGNEHQPTVVGIMSYFGKHGLNWIRKLIKNRIADIKPGSLPNIKSYPENDQIKIIKLLTVQAAKDRIDLLPFLSEIVDSSTVRLLAPFLSSSDWKNRALVAEAIGRVGITSSSGLVMEIIADTDWQVKRRFLEHLNIKESRFSAVFKILSYILTDSRIAIRNFAERILLTLGAVECDGTHLEDQRKRIEKKYRSHLLRAASKNEDIDSKWLGVSIEKMDPIPVMNEDEDSEFEGVSLSDIESTQEKETPSTDAGAKLDLMAALLSAKKEVESTDVSVDSVISEITSTDSYDDSMSIADQLILLLKQVSTESGKDVQLSELKNRALEQGFSESDFKDIITQLEKEGTIYRSSKGTISYVDIDF